MQIARLLGAVLMLTTLSATSPVHPLTIDDVLDTVEFDRAASSPDGEWVAAVVPRAARAGETAGRNAYEIDPSRNDVWLVSRRTGQRRNLTNGAKDAAGFWCATWSPDGRMLAMLSTKPEASEPRGGDNVRIYVWERSSDRLRRVTSSGVMTQSRYGSGLYPLDLRGGADGSTIAHSCRDSDENAPFLWLDKHRLLSLLLPTGQISALIDQYGRPFDEAMKTRVALRAGAAPTVSAMGSGKARIQRDEHRWRAELTILDVDRDTRAFIASIPTYPFAGALTIAVSPNGRRAAVLASVGTLAFLNGSAPPFQIEDWHAEKRLGIVDLAPGVDVHWADLPLAARLPLELFDWTPSGTRIAFRARQNETDRSARAFILDAETRSVSSVSQAITINQAWLGQSSGQKISLWTDDEHLLLRARGARDTRDDWWLIPSAEDLIRLTGSFKEVPDTFRRRSDGSLVTVGDRRFFALDKGARQLNSFGTQLRTGARIAWPIDSSNRASTFLVASNGDFDELDSMTASRIGSTALAEGALQAFDHGEILWTEKTSVGLFLRATRVSDRKTHTLLELDSHLASVDWGETRVIDYVGASGRSLKAAVILPPDYKQGRRYPVLTWTYGGFIVRGPNSYWVDRYLPGFYNLYLYAAKGYVVLIPSIPLASDGKEDVYGALPGGVLPAIDRLADLGIADPDRVSVMGQSFGGYTVYALISQTDRFRAAVALAGITDPAQAWGQFDPIARGYPGFEHEKSANWSIWENGFGFGKPPYEAKDYYGRASALAHVDRVNTPVLLAHGELDMRDPLVQADTFFFALYRQGKTARLLRYWGENHSLAASPANVRDIFRETITWLEVYNSPRRPLVNH